MILKNKHRFFLMIAAVLLSLIVMYFLLIIKGLVEEENPKNWNPYFNFYRSSQCMETPEDTCYLEGIRSKISHGTLKDIFLSLRMNKTNNIPVNFEEIKCNRDGIENVTGTVYKCWFINPLPNNLKLESDLWK